MMGGESRDGGFLEFSNQTVLGGITSRVYIDKYSTKELKKMWSKNCCRMMKGYDPHEPTTMGGRVSYVLLCLRYGLKIEAMRIWRRIFGGIGDFLIFSGWTLIMAKKINHRGHGGHRELLFSLCPLCSRFSKTRFRKIIKSLGSIGGTG